MKLMIGYEFWWSPTYSLNLQLQMCLFFPKILNPWLKNTPGFIRISLCKVKIVPQILSNWKAHTFLKITSKLWSGFDFSGLLVFFFVFSTFSSPKRKIKLKHIKINWKTPYDNFCLFQLLTLQNEKTKLKHVKTNWKTQFDNFYLFQLSALRNEKLN